MQSPLRGGIIFGGCVCLIVTLWFWPTFRTHHIERSTAQIQIGAPAQTVREIVGAPWKDEACGAMFAGSPNGCFEELVYAHPYAPIVPEYWVVYLDSNRRVLHQAHLVSP